MTNLIDVKIGQRESSQTLPVEAPEGVYCFSVDDSRLHRTDASGRGIGIYLVTGGYLHELITGQDGERLVPLDMAADYLAERGIRSVYTKEINSQGFMGLKRDSDMDNYHNNVRRGPLGAEEIEAIAARGIEVIVLEEWS